MSDLKNLACRALDLAGAKNLSIVTAESCTAGKLSGLLSEAPGAAERLHGSFVTYTKENKTRALGVRADVEKHGAVCREVACAMAEGALQRSPADLAVSVTGVAGPIRMTTAIPSGVSALQLRASERRHGRLNTITAIPAARSCKGGPWRTPSSFSSPRWTRRDELTLTQGKTS